MARETKFPEFMKAAMTDGAHKVVPPGMSEGIWVRNLNMTAIYHGSRNAMQLLFTNTYNPEDSSPLTIALASVSQIMKRTLTHLRENSPEQTRELWPPANTSQPRTEQTARPTITMHPEPAVAQTTGEATEAPGDLFGALSPSKPWFLALGKLREAQSVTAGERNLLMVDFSEYVNMAAIETFCKELQTRTQVVELIKTYFVTWKNAQKAYQEKLLDRDNALKTIQNCHEQFHSTLWALLPVPFPEIASLMSKRGLWNHHTGEDLLGGLR